VLVLEAVAELNWCKDVAWARRGEFGELVVLNAETRDDDVARVVAALAYDPECLSDNIGQTTKNLVESERSIVAGGLRLRSGAFVLTPSCCCGLESWREWYGVRKGGQSPWLGHSPDPWIDCSGDKAIAHTDGGGDSSDDRTLQIEYRDIRVALNKTCEDLTLFVEVLRRWSDRNGADRRLADWFGKTFDVTDTGL
jgi:hypothetical protein